MIETDMAKRLRREAEGIRHFIDEIDKNTLIRLLKDAAAEIDRYYNGMMAWKTTAEAKDAEYVKTRFDKEQNL